MDDGVADVGGGAGAAVGEAAAAARGGGGALLAAARRWKRQRESQETQQWRSEQRAMAAAEHAVTEEQRAAVVVDENHAAKVERQHGVEAEEDEEAVVRLPDGHHIQCASVSEVDWIVQEIYTRRAYLPGGICLPLPSHPEAVIIDGGAHAGIFTLWAAGRAPAATVVAIEPSPRSFRRLGRNVDAAGLTGRTTCLSLAIGDAPSVAPLTYYRHMPGSSTLHPTAQWAQRVAFRPQRWEHMYAAEVVTVEVTTLSAVLARHVTGEVSLLKLDVEHSEVAALSGIGAADWPRIHQVVVEVHTESARAEVQRLLLRHYAEVGACDDEELAQCGLAHAIVYARLPRERSARDVAPAASMTQGSQADVAITGA